MTVKVAVITRTKDRPLFLKRAITSITDQTFTDFVHVIVNDGGDVDEINSIIDSLDSNIKSKIRLFHRNNSSGAPDTIFNESIDRVSSEYFAIHDDDDAWHPNFLMETVSLLDKTPSAGAVVARTDKVVEEIKNGSLREQRRTPWMPDLKVISLYRQCIDNQLTPISTLFKRTAYVEVGKFDSSLPIVGDWEFGLRLLSRFDAEYLDPGYPLAFYHHRKRTGGSQDSVSDKEKHRYYTNLVANRYLRREVESGRLGIGYIISKLKYNQQAMYSKMKKVLPKAVINRVNRQL